MTSAEEIMQREREKALDAARKARIAGATFDNGKGDRRAAMTQLAQAFPVLEDAPGVEPWIPEELGEWAQGSDWTAARGAAATFVLSVWDSGKDWMISDHEQGFNFQLAYKVWDPINRAAFVAWAEAPWWP